MRPIGQYLHLGISAASALLGLKKPPLPPAVQIEPTNYCNLRCSMCQREALIVSG